MTTSYNARLELAAALDAAAAEQLLDALPDHHAAVGRSPFGRAEVILTLPAESVRQAATTALALVADAGGDVIALEVLTTADFDRRLGVDVGHIPELVSVTEAAAALGVTRQAVLQRIESGSLPATRIGTAWAVPRSAVNA